ncbi:MAG: hypothetical protein ACFCUN_01340 [Hyphomicrobiaceae bacterium]
MTNAAHTLFVISYDLATPLRNKHAVADAIMASGEAWARPLECTWYVRGAETLAALSAALAPVFDDEDGFIIQRVDEDVALGNTTLRWFRARARVEPGPGADILPFPLPRAETRADSVTNQTLAEAS